MRKAILYIIIVYVCLSIAVAVDLENGTKLEPNDLNVSYIMGVNFTFDEIAVANDTVKLNYTNFTFIPEPSYAYVNLTLHKFNSTYVLFNLTHTNLSGVTSNASLTTKGTDDIATMTALKLWYNNAVVGSQVINKTINFTLVNAEAELIYKNNTPPTVNNASITASSTYVGATLTLTSNVTDAEDNISVVTYYLAKPTEPATEVNAAMTLNATSGLYEATYTSTEHLGAYNITYIIANDTLNGITNQSYGSTRNLTLSSNPAAYTGGGGGQPGYDFVDITNITENSTLYFLMQKAKYPTFDFMGIAIPNIGTILYPEKPEYVWIAFAIIIAFLALILMTILSAQKESRRRTEMP